MPFPLPDPLVRADSSVQRNFDALASAVGELQVPRVTAFSVYRSANLGLGVASPAYCDLDSEEFDLSGAYGVNAGFGSRRGFTVPVDGIYSFAWRLSTTANMANYFQSALRKNTSDWKYGEVSIGGQSSVGSALIKCVPGDFFEMVAYWANGGAAVTLLAGSQNSFFCGQLVSRGA